jgi:NTE family protein
MDSRMNEASPQRRRINVALQGGGSHGAFTWGVLDRLLEEQNLEIDGLSGTSAGAMNAIVVAEGMIEGGREKARAQLHDFWAAVSREAIFSPFQCTPFDVLAANWSLAANPALLWLDIASQLVSPYQFNPLNINPLRSLLLDTVNFDRVRACQQVRLFVSATNVHTGRARVFAGPEVTVEAVLASACLPQLYQAVLIDGEPYWDGGYMGNPVLWPFFNCCESQDLLIIQINPIRRPTTPMTPREITDRVNEISFNASLIRELMHVEFINAALRRGDLSGQSYREIRLHHIDGGGLLQDAHASSKLNAEWAFLLRLRDLGRRAADDWLRSSAESIGRRSTMQLDDFRLDRPSAQRAGPGAAPPGAF